MVGIKPRLQLVKNATAEPEPEPLAADAAVRAQVEALYQAQGAALRRYLARMLPGRSDEVEVIVQETFIKLLRQPNLTHLKANARAYLYAVATNLLRDSLRYQVRRRSDYHDPFSEEELPSAEPSPCASAQWLQSLERIKAELHRLKPVTRKVFLLSRFEGMTYPEIAEVLKLSTRSVERHMSKAMVHLQSVLDP